MTPLPPDREAVILREMREAFPMYDADTDETIRLCLNRSIAACDRIWSHVESLHAAAGAGSAPTLSEEDQKWVKADTAWLDGTLLDYAAKAPHTPVCPTFEVGFLRRMRAYLTTYALAYAKMARGGLDERAVKERECATGSPRGMQLRWWGAADALDRLYSWMIENGHLGCDRVQEFKHLLFKHYEPSLPRPAIAPVPLSDGRTLAWDGDAKEYRVTWPGGYCRPCESADDVVRVSAVTASDARAILAFVAQVEEVSP